MLTVGSLFSGVGMFDLGYHLAGFKIAWQCDFDEYCQEVLKARRDVFGDTTIYSDIRDLGKGRKHEPEKTDVLIGGFPCQPFSIAGLRQGESDNRNMWGEFARLIGDLRPRAIMLENVPAITMDYGVRVVADLAEMGYRCQWGIISAQDVGASHTRERWWLVGYANGARLAGAHREQSQHPRTTGFSRSRHSKLYKPGVARDAHGTSYRVDKHRFPNGLGEQQHANEPNRTVTQKPPQWKGRVKALGNGGMAQIAYLLALGIKETLEANHG